VVSLWLPRWPTDLVARAEAPEPRRARALGAAEGARISGAAESALALVAAEGGTLRLSAVSAAAAAAGLAPGMSLADARALEPALRVRPAEPLKAAQALDRLADWAGAFSPWVAVDGADGVLLDITGCAHLFGGEAALLDRLLGALGRRGFAARAALADTLGAAWAVARFGAARGPNAKAEAGIVAPGAQRAALAPLAVAALRLDPALTAALETVGLRRIGDLLALARAPLAARFGARLLARLDQALGKADEPISPRRPVAPYRAGHAFAEPVHGLEPVQAALVELMVALCRRLECDRRGARRLELSLFLLDGDVRRLGIGTSRASRAIPALMRLFAERLDNLDLGDSPGAAVEALTLTVTASEPLAPAQADLVSSQASVEADGDDRLAALLDRLINRLGATAVGRTLPKPSHVPERALSWRPALTHAGAETWPALPALPALPPRPLRLLMPPELVEAVAMLPDAPPSLFRWRGRVHRVLHASGPERIEGEWWWEDAPVRDYYRVEDSSGARFWLYRAGAYQAAATAPRWYLHGLFG